MLRRPLVRIALPALLALTMFVAAALPSSSQTTPLVEGLLEEVGSIEGINQLDPVLNPVSDLILTLTNLIDDVLADVPLVNTLALGGDDVIDAAIAFSQATFPDGADTAILSREDLFADGFSSGGFQGHFGAPLLFTDSDDLDMRTGMELLRLGMDTVTILGGDAALSPIVVNKLEIAGLNVIRVGGPTRVETAVAAADVTHPDATSAVLVRAYPDAGMGDDQAYADLLAAGPFAAENDVPILMTTSDALHPAVASHIADAGITDVTIIGGTSAVSQGIEDGLADQGVTVQRVAGANRFATAVAIAEARGFTNAAAADRIIIAESGGRDDVWGPGFASTAHADQNAAPVLLTDGALIPAETMAFLVDSLVDNLLDGGPAVVCASFVDPIACEAVGALMLLNLGLVEDLLGTLEGIPLLGDILAALGLAGLLDDTLTTLVSLLEGLGASPDEVAAILGALATADPAQAQALIDAIATDSGLTTEQLEGVLDGSLDLDEVLGTLDGGTDGGTDGDPLDGVGDAVDDAVDDIVGGVGGVVGGIGDGGGLLGG
jgi:putative cell wall-binding protein